MIIIKFGGTSVGNAERIKNAAKIVKSRIKKKPVVVVSAVSKITDMLIKLAHEFGHRKSNNTLLEIKSIHYKILEKLGIDKDLLKNDFEELSNLLNKTKSDKYIDAKRLDEVQSFGERMSSKIFAAELNKIGVNAKSFNSWDLGFLTNAEFGNAEPLEISYANLKKNITKLNVVPVITGFIGKTKHGEITTLGRGGSDYTAAIIGAAINADEIQIWTDVDGIMSADPKTLGTAKTISNVSFAEACELSYFGAKVLHPKTMLPAMHKNIPVKVLNSFNPKNKGTAILSKTQKSEKTVKAIAYKDNITLINIESTRMLGAYGFLAKLFDIFSNSKKSVDVVSTSEVSVSLTIENGGNMGNILTELKGIADIKVYANKSIICVVGEGMNKNIDIPSRTFAALAKNKIHVEMISMGASEINITLLVDEKCAKKAVRALHEEYFE